MLPIDLRSDFLSRPTPEMISAMMNAAANRGGFGLREDSEVSSLEALAAQLLGKEDALFCPSCGMANQIAIHLAVRPGFSLVAESNSHVIMSEAGGPAGLSGVMCKAILGIDGVPDFDALGEAFLGVDTQRSRVSLLVMENTHVRSGGAVLDIPTCIKMQQIANSYGASVHLDGSRLFNAAAALKVSAAQICTTADTVAFSLNKGLAAPLGAILAGSRDFIEEAVRVRQMFGGGWRPAGIPAAAGRIALQTMPQRLAEDNAVALELSKALTGLQGISSGQRQVWTNLVLIDLDPRFGGAQKFSQTLAKFGVLVLPFGKNRVRLAIYYEITRQHIPVIVTAFTQALYAN